MHNFGTVFRFETIRTLKKKSFWLLSLLFPLMIGVIMGIIYFSGKASDRAAEDTEKQKFSFLVVDESGLVNKQLVSSMEGSFEESHDAAKDKVRDGKVDAAFYYPKDLTRDEVKVYGKDVGIFTNSRYEAVAKVVLDQSVALTVTPSTASVLANKFTVKSEMFKDGEPHDSIKQLILPGIFLVLFYLMIATFGNQMLNSTVEEKENRVIEMILTTINTKALIVGKIFSLIVLGFLQILIVLVPVLISYLLLKDVLELPAVDLSNLPVDPMRIGIGLVIFSLSFILFTGLLVMIGAASPTAKEAGSFFGIVVLLIFGPLYAAPLFVTSPDEMIVQVLTYFPFTAPIPLLLRNAVGNLEVYEALIAAVILAVSAVVVMLLAVRVFGVGALQYDRRLSLKEIIGRRT